MIYCHIVTYNFMICDIDLGHVMAALMHILTSFVQNDNNSLPNKDRCICTCKLGNKHCVRFTHITAATNGYVHTGTAITVHLENDRLMQRLVVFVCCKIEIVRTCHECELTHKLLSKTDLLRKHPLFSLHQRQCGFH